MFQDLFVRHSLLEAGAGGGWVGCPVAGGARLYECAVALDVAGGATAAGSGEAHVGGHFGKLFECSEVDVELGL